MRIQKGGDLGTIKLAAKVYETTCTIFLVVSIFIRYDLWLQWAKTVEMYTQFDTLVNTGIWKNLSFEICLCVIAPYPFLDGLKYRENVLAYETSIEYEVNDILLYFSFCRFYLLLRFLLYMTQFMSPRSQRVCAMHGTEADLMFAVKGVMKQMPEKLLIWALVISTVIFGFQLRLFEGVISE